MGEAKRRRQLGLMPQVHTFEAELNLTPQGWDVQWTRAPEGVPLEQALDGLLQAVPTPAGWPADYRTRMLRAGRVRDFINSLEDLENALPVPEKLRVSGDWLNRFGPSELRQRDPESARQFTLLGGGEAVRLRSVDVLTDSGWAPLPDPANTPKHRQYLMQHPLAREQGELKETFQVTQHRQGLMMTDPEPPTALLEALEGVARSFNGATEDWDAAHASMLAAAAPGSAEYPEGSPESRRLVLELRSRAPLNAPGNVPVIEWGDDVVVLQPGSAAFSMDGHTWFSYYDPEAEPEEDELDEFFQQILDVGTVEVTVYADGRIEWEEGDVPKAQAARLREQMRERTGAGDPARWAEFSRSALITAYEDSAPYLADVPAAKFPIPHALRLDVPQEAIEDPEYPGQLMFESQVSYGGDWADIWLDDLPPELEAKALGKA